MSPRRQHSTLCLSEIPVSVKTLLTYLTESDLSGGLYKHGTIIRTGITCKKISCYMRDSAYRWFIVKKAKIF